MLERSRTFLENATCFFLDHKKITVKKRNMFTSVINYENAGKITAKKVLKIDYK